MSERVAYSTYTVLAIYSGSSNFIDTKESIQAHMSGSLKYIEAAI